MKKLRAHCREHRKQCLGCRKFVEILKYYPPNFLLVKLTTNIGWYQNDVLTDVPITKREKKTNSGRDADIVY